MHGCAWECMGVEASILCKRIGLSGIHLRIGFHERSWPTRQFFYINHKFSTYNDSHSCISTRNEWSQHVVVHLAGVQATISQEHDCSPF